jgi:hypothetical protein
MESFPSCPVHFILGTYASRKGIFDLPTCWLFLLTLHHQYSSRRFVGLSEEDTRDLHDYILNITLAKGSGEYCICETTSIPVLCITLLIGTAVTAHILAPGAHARMPLVDRIYALKVPVTFVCAFLLN